MGQAVEKSRVFGLGNQFLVGASYDQGRVKYGASSEIGAIGDKLVVNGLGITLGEDFLPRDILATNKYMGIYFSNTLDVTDKLALTVGGRYNFARITLPRSTAAIRKPTARRRRVSSPAPIRSTPASSSRS